VPSARSISLLTGAPVAPPIDTDIVEVPRTLGGAREIAAVGIFAHLLICYQH
jgi:hypothetical protein